MYNTFKTLVSQKGFIFSFGGIQEYKNGKYAVLYFGEAKSKEEDRWEITEHVDQDVLTVMYNLYSKAIKTIEKI